VAAVTTDKSGYYQIVGLPVGKYSIRAAKSPFVSPVWNERNESDSDLRVDLTDRAIVEKVDFALVRGAAIAGTVVDEFSEPVVGAQVMPYRFRYVRGRRQLVRGGSAATTDDLGQFRLFGLSPDDYTVGASLRVPFGDYDAGESGYALTYAPGTPNASESQPIHLTVGQAVTHVQIALFPSRVARVGGVLVGTNGAPISYGVVNVVDRSTNVTISVGQVNADGSFLISGVPPGEYFLKSDSSGPDGVSQVARLPIVVRGDDVLGVRLAALPLVTVRGRIVFGSQLRSLPRLGAAGVELTRLGDDGVTEMRPRPAPIGPDHTFELASYAGRVKVTLMGLPPAWSIQQVRAGEADITNGFDLVPHDTPFEVAVELTDRFPRLTGKVLDARGEEASEYSVIVFSKDPDLWAWNSRHVVLGAPSTDGRGFEIGPVPPGDYYIVAVPRMFDDRWADIEYLEAMSRDAKGVTLNEGDVRLLTLSLSTR
jgi:hypothetical protein